MENNKDSSAGRRREPKDQRIAIRLSKSDLELINKLSLEEDLPIAQIVRKAVKLYKKSLEL